MAPTSPEKMDRLDDRSDRSVSSLLLMPGGRHIHGVICRSEWIKRHITGITETNHQLAPLRQTRTPKQYLVAYTAIG